MSGRQPVLKYAAMAVAALCCMARADGQENMYDVLGKALVPIANVFARNEDGAAARHALVLDAHLVEASGLPPELQGQAVHVALMTPDEVLVQAPIAGELMTVCRDGDTLWGTPGSKIQALVDQATAAATDAPGKKKKKKAADIILGPLALPFPQKDLVFLPLLFAVEDGGTEAVAGAPCRVLDTQVMPQLAKSLHATGWTARVWVGADYGIVKIALKGPDWSGTVAIDKLAYPAELPDGTFQPTGTDVLRLTAAQFMELMGRAGRR
jgi:hypothetical protein